MEPTRRVRGDVAWLLFWLVASSAWCVTAAKQLGGTADEAPYLRMGLERWRTGSHGPFMAVGTMPLAIDVQTFPLYAAERWRGAPHDLDANLPAVLPKLLPWARAGNLPFWWAVLVYGWLIARRQAGPWGGRLAAPLLACEPNLLAHAGLATTDIAVTACALALVYHFEAGRGRGWAWRVGAPAVCFALLLLAKASAVVFGPVCLAVVGAACARRSADPRPVRALVLDGAQLLALGFALAALYIGCEWRPSGMIPAQAANRLPEGFARAALVAYGRLPIFSNLTEGILFQVFQNRTGTAAYLLGEVHPRGVWYYFPVALSMKVPVPLLALPLVVAVLRPRALGNVALLAALALLALSVTYKVQNGVRMVLPLVALLATGLGAAVAASAGAGGWRRPAAVAAGVAAVAWAALGTATARPDGLCYFNEFWRGRPGYERLNDSNYDWGQGLKALDKWHRKQDRPPLLVWTFGNDPAFRLMPVTQYQLDSLGLSDPEAHLPAVRGHYLAASAVQVYGYWDTPAVRFLRSRKPVAQAGTYLIYDFTAAP